LIRHQIAVLLLIGVSIISGLSMLLDVYKSYSDGPAQIAVFQARFASIRKALPAHGVVGYATDAAPDQTTRATEYYLTQYALSPVVVEDTSKQSLVVANFHSDSPNPQVLRALHLVPVQNFGNGVFLLKSAPQ
jgi:hypothetical protein